MGIRDLFLFALIFGALPFCLFRPWIGILVFSWIGYMNPHRLTWGLAFDFPFAQIVAGATLLGFVIQVARTGMPKMPWKSETVLLLLLWALFFVTTLFALLPDIAAERLIYNSKIMLMSLLTVLLIDDRKKLRWLVLLISLSIGFYGIKGGLFAIATGGNFRVYGPQGSFIQDNTALGIALSMVLPLLYLQTQTEEERRVRWFFLGAFLLTVLGTAFTYSRGAFLGLVVVLGMLFLHLRIGWKVAVITVMTLSVPALLTLVPEQFVERIETLGAVEADGSANARLNAWRAAWSVALARPLTGGGFQVIDDVPTVQMFDPAFTRFDVGAHSIYFEVLAENGFIALFVFVALLISAMLSARAISRRFAGTNHPFKHYGDMLLISIVAYAVTGTFLEFVSFDLFYHLIAMIIIVKRLAPQELAALRSPVEKPAVERRPATYGPWIRPATRAATPPSSR